eukprot:m.360169 g.360169  ORF g.360169 m.360169 type:complete len:583 (+) comp16637_c0_seq1:267-2015(+)
MSVNTLVLAFAAVGLTAGLVGVAVSSVSLHAEESTKDKDVLLGHFVVADAGSTHTEFTLYKWEAACPLCNETAVYGTFARQLPFECDLKPGISSLTPPEVTQIVRTCLDQAAGNISAETVAATPFQLRATAGMRLLDYQNTTLSDEILDAVTAGSVGTGFSNAGEPSTASIMSGEDEGAFSWAAANYLQGTLTDTLTAAEEGGMLAVRQLETVGALDLGGASTQITFIPPEGTDVLPRDTGYLNLYNSSIEVYTHSYLCFGQLQMTNRRLAFLLSATADADDVVDPCFPEGFASANFTEEYLEELAANPCIDGLTTFNVTAHVGKRRLGSSNATQCSASVENLYDSEAVNNAPLPTDANGKFHNVVAQQPAFPTTPVYAFSAYWYAANFLFPDRCTTSTPCNPTLTQFLDAAHELCDKNLSDIQADNPTTPEKYLVEYCQNSIYIHGLLSKYNMPDDASNVYFVNQINSISVGWAFGFSLNSSATVLPKSFKQAEAVDAPIVTSMWCVVLRCASDPLLAKTRAQRLHAHQRLRVIKSQLGLSLSTPHMPSTTHNLKGCCQRFRQAHTRRTLEIKALNSSIYH